MNKFSFRQICTLLLLVGLSGTGLAFFPNFAFWKKNTNSQVPLLTQQWTQLSNYDGHYHNQRVHWNGSRLTVFGGCPPSDWINDAKLGWGCATQSTRFLSYDPTTDVWTPISGAPSPACNSRIDHNGKALFFGIAPISGFCNYIPAAIQTASLYDSDTNSFSAASTTNIPIPRFNHVYLQYDSKVFIWGGMYGQSPGTQTNTGGIYDFDTDTWTSVSTTGAPAARTNLFVQSFFDSDEDILNAFSVLGLGSFVIHKYGDKIVMWGGSNTATGGVYDVGTDSWVTMPTTGAPQGPANIGHALVGDKIYMFGGGTFNSSGSGTSYGDGAIYNISSNTWTAMSSTNAPSARYIGPTYVIGDYILFVGGMSGSTPYVLDRTYQISTDTWHTIDLTGKYTGTQIHYLYQFDNKLLIGNSDTAAVITPSSQDVTSVDMTNFPTGYIPRRNIGAGLTLSSNGIAGIDTGREFYLMFGLDSGGVTNAVLKFESDTNSWSDATGLPNSPAAMMRHSAHWTGTEVLVLGGTSNSGIPPTGLGTFHKFE